MNLPPKSIIDWFPPEILIIIFLLCSRQDHISLCQTCKFFDEFGTSTLYKKIRLPLPKSFKKLCQTLSANPRKASAVRHVTISEPYPYPSFALVPALNTCLVVILRCLTSVEKLTLDSRLFTQAYDEMLRDASFPMLCSLTMDTTYINTLLLAPFLNRHPAITKLALNGTTSFVGPITLPNARYLKASSSFFRSLSGLVPISTATVSWDPYDNICKFPMRVLSQHSGDSLIRLVFTYVDSTPDIVQDVATHLPKIQVLRISSYAPGSLRNEELDAVTESLGRLNFLRRFELSVAVPNTPMDQDTISRWENACPTLESCTIYGLVWKRKHGQMKRRGGRS